MFNNNLDLIEVAYEFVKKNANKEHAFNDIVDHIFSTKGINKEEFDENLGNFYVELLRDTRFLVTSNNTWILSESLSLSEYKSKKNDLYDFSSNEIREDYDESLITLPEIKDELDDKKDTEFDFIADDVQYEDLEEIEEEDAEE